MIIMHFKDAALSAFHHESEVLRILKQSPAETPGIQVLQRLIMTSAKYDSAAAVSVVTDPVASPITRGVYSWFAANADCIVIANAACFDVTDLMCSCKCSML